MEIIACIFMAFFLLITFGKVRDANGRRDQQRRIQERRNNQCNYKDEGRGTQNNSEWLRLGSGPVKR